MPSNLTISSSRSAVSAPDENEVYNWPLIRAAIQGVANRSEWNKTDFIVGANSNIAAVGDYPSTTSWTTITRSAVNAEHTLSLSSGDMVFLMASGSIQPQAVDSAYALRIYDGSAAVAATMMNKGAAWTAGEIIPWSIQGLYIAGSTGSVTFSLQGQRGSTVMTVTEGTSGKLTFAYVWLKKGAA